jgi:hypothetical protein
VSGIGLSFAKTLSARLIDLSFAKPHPASVADGRCSRDRLRKA